MAAERLVVQIPISDLTDFDSLIDIENALTLSFLKDRAAKVDGHLLGQGRLNIFIVPVAAPGPIVDRVKAALAEDGLLEGAVIARQSGVQGQYSVMWPVNHDGEFSL